MSPSPGRYSLVRLLTEFWNTSGIRTCELAVMIRRWLKMKMGLQFFQQSPNVVDLDAFSSWMKRCRFFSESTELRHTSTHHLTSKAAFSGGVGREAAREGGCLLRRWTAKRSTSPRCRWYFFVAAKAAYWASFSMSRKSTSEGTNAVAKNHFPLRWKNNGERGVRKERKRLAKSSCCWDAPKVLH